jgi:hypothetical protein
MRSDSARFSPTIIHCAVFKGLHEKLPDPSINLKKLTKFIENLELPGGRPPTDRHGFVYRIALGFNHHFKKPTTYKEGKNPESQPFYEVVKICFEAVGMKTKDPTRSIKAAIKQLNQTEYET